MVSRLSFVRSPIRTRGRVSDDSGVGREDGAERRRNSLMRFAASLAHSTVSGILPMRRCHSRGPVSCTDVPLASTATVTGMSFTSNS